MLLDRCPVLSCHVLSCLCVCHSVCNVGVLWPNGCMDQNKTWPAGRPWTHCVRWGPRSPSPKGAQPLTIFRPYLLWPNSSMHPDGTWSEDPSNIVLDGDPALRQSPQFLAYVYCAKMAGWIKMPLGMEVGVGRDHIVLNGDPAAPPQKKGHNPSPTPNFRPMFVVAKRLDG